MNRKKKIFMILSLVWSLSLFTVVTYSWVARSWTPEVEYSDINIATSGALVISIQDKDGNEGEYNEINLNELTNTDSFALKQVSSSNGKAFVGANFNPVLSNGVPVYDADVNGKYIETEFWLKAQAYNTSEITNIKDIYLHEDTDIIVSEEDEQLNLDLSIRVSIDLPGILTQPIILCKNRSRLYENPETSDASDGYYETSMFAADTSESHIESTVGSPVFADYKTNTKSLYTHLPM